MSDDPAISGIIANCRDVTQRIENEVKTEQSIERFNAVSRATSDAIWDWDFLSGEVIWNKGVEGIFGHNHILYSQQWWYSQVHPEDVVRVSNSFKAFIDSKESRIESEYRFRCSDGGYKHVLDRAFLIFNKDGDAVRMIGSMQDISDRINYIRSIEEQNEKLRDIAWIQSHVVRAPLARIMGLSKLIYHENTDDSLRKELLDHLDTSTAELDDIIKDIVRKTDEI
jgi:PAS domain S-box-containing protein